MKQLVHGQTRWYVQTEQGLKLDMKQVQVQVGVKDDETWVVRLNGEVLEIVDCF